MGPLIFKSFEPSNLSPNENKKLKKKKKVNIGAKAFLKLIIFSSS